MALRRTVVSTDLEMYLHPPPLYEPHRITSPIPLQLTIRDTGTPVSLACWLLPFPKIHGVSLEASMTQIGGVPNEF